MRIDGDGVEHYVAATALHIEDIEQILDTYVVSCEGGRIIAREFWRGARDCSWRVAVGGGVNEYDAVGLLERFGE